MSKVNKLLGVALGLQVVLLVAVGFARDDQKIVQVGKVFDAFEPAKVTKIEVTGNAGGEEKKLTTVVLEKQGTTWGVASADGYPADEEKVKTFLENVQKLKSSGPVVSKEAYYSKLEVADDDYQRKIVITHDGKPLELYLGSSPGFKRTHLRRAGEKEVLLVEGVSVYDVGFRGADWVDRAYFKVPESDVWAVTLQNAKGTLKLEKSPAGEWAATGLRGDQKLAPTKVEDLVRKVASVNLEEPVGKGAKPEHGLDQPLATVTLVTGTSTVAGLPPPSTVVKTLAIGAKAKDGNQYYVDSSDSEYVVLAPGWAIEPLTTKTAADLLDTPAK